METPIFRKVLIIEDQSYFARMLYGIVRRLWPQCQVTLVTWVKNFNSEGANVLESRLVMDGGDLCLSTEVETRIVWADFRGQLAIVDGSVRNMIGRPYLKALINEGAVCLTDGSDDVYNQGVMKDHLAHAILGKRHDETPIQREERLIEAVLAAWNRKHSQSAPADVNIAS